MRTVIFDLDGTLADTSGDLIAAANACFQELGLGSPIDPVKDQAMAFRGGRAMLKLGFQRCGVGPERVEEQFPIFIEYYTQDIDKFTFLYSGCVEAVDALRGAGYAVGICTNKPEKQAEILMARLGVRDRFESLIGADTLPVRKPDPAPYVAAVQRAGGDLGRSLLVGDTKTDRETARAANVPSVLVTFGPGDEDVRDLQPEGLLDDYADLSSVVAELIG